MKPRWTVAGLTVLLVTAACGHEADTQVGQPVTTQDGGYQAKTADPIVQAVTQVGAARTRGSAELSGLSTAVVHVRADGAIEVALHTPEAVTAAQLDEIRSLGVQVVVSVSTPAVGGAAPGGLVQAWVPADRMASVAELPWVAAVTTPSYGSTGG